MRAFKFSSLWLLFAVSYIIFFALIFLFFPEVWLYNLFLEPHQDFINEGTWDKIFMLTIMWSALVINLLFIFFSLIIKQRLHKSVTSGFRCSGLRSTFKFLSLWLLFAISYVVFFALIFSFFPETWLYNLFIKSDQDSIEKGIWNTIFMLIILLSTLVLNLVFIFLSLSIIQRLRNKKKTAA